MGAFNGQWSQQMLLLSISHIYRGITFPPCLAIDLICDRSSTFRLCAHMRSFRPGRAKQLRFATYWYIMNKYGKVLSSREPMPGPGTKIEVQKKTKGYFAPLPPPSGLFFAAHLAWFPQNKKSFMLNSLPSKYMVLYLKKGYLLTPSGIQVDCEPSSLQGGLCEILKNYAAAIKFRQLCYWDR